MNFLNFKDIAFNFKKPDATEVFVQTFVKGDRSLRESLVNQLYRNEK